MKKIVLTLLISLSMNIGYCINTYQSSVNTTNSEEESKEPYVEENNTNSNSVYTPNTDYNNDINSTNYSNNSTGSNNNSEMTASEVFENAMKKAQDKARESLNSTYYITGADIQELTLVEIPIFGVKNVTSYFNIEINNYTTKESIRNKIKHQFEDKVLEWIVSSILISFVLTLFYILSLKYKIKIS